MEYKEKITERKPQFGPRWLKDDKTFLKYVVKGRRVRHVADTYSFSKHSKAIQQEMTKRTVHTRLIHNLKSSGAGIKALSSLWIILS